MIRDGLLMDCNLPSRFNSMMAAATGTAGKFAGKLHRSIDARALNWPASRRYHIQTSSSLTFCS